MPETRRPHPIREICRSSAITAHDLARATGYSTTYAALALDNLIVLSERFKRACSEFLQLPEGVLFTPDSNPWNTYQGDEWAQDDINPWATDGGEA